MSGHLFESTLFLAAAVLLAQIPLLAARTRYVIVFTALMKFAIPSAIVPRLLALLGFDLARVARGTILIAAFGSLSSAARPATSASVWPVVAMAIWLAVAIALLARALLRGRVALRGALADGRAAQDPEVAALERARVRTTLSRPVRLVISPSMPAPATAGILHPVIILPSAAALTEPELETILTHECAHIARHDNLLSVIESLAGCALWFHPLVWIARRVLDGTREEACDAIVVASGDPDLYLTALRKVCGAAIGPRLAAVSCIVSNTIRERMEAIMNIGSRRLLNHRAVIATVIAVLSLTTLGIGVARALPAGDGPTSKYKVGVTLTRESSPDVFVFDVTVTDRKSGVVISSANLRGGVDQWASATSELTSKEEGQHATVIRAIGHADGTAEVDVTVDHETPMMAKLIAKSSEASTKPDEGISLDLKDADIRDLLKTFGQLSSTEIIVDEDVYGSVTVKLHDTPWTEALERILSEANLRSERNGNTIHVHRR